MKHASFAAALLFSLSSAAFANPTTRPASSAPTDRVDQLIEQLGADDFKARAAAAAQLRKIGRSALPALKNVKHDDAEIASWCASLAEQIDPTPRPDVARLVARDAIRVLDGGGLIRLQIEQPVGNRAARAELQRVQRLLQVRQLQLDEARINDAINVKIHAEQLLEIEGDLLKIERDLDERANLRLVRPRLVEPPAAGEPVRTEVRDERKW